MRLQRCLFFGSMQLVTMLDPNLFRPSGDLIEHSQLLDEKFGLKVSKTESLLQSQVKKVNQKLNSRTWIGLDGQILNTPYGELFHMARALSPYKIDSVVDLGAGYGRVGLVFSSFHPEVQFTGYEFVGKRVEEGNRVFRNLGLNQSQLIEKDILSEFELPAVQLYFIYDFSNTQDLKVLVGKLSDMMMTRRFFVIAKGRAVRSLIQHQYPSFWAMDNAFHTDNWSLYRSQ